MAAKKKTTSKKAESTTKAWLGVSKATPRIAQDFGVSWRTAGKPGTFVSLWQEGPNGNFHYTVPPKGSRRVQTLDPGKFVFILRELDGTELARTEVVVRT
jgi:hypothetical protein